MAEAAEENVEKTRTYILIGVALWALLGLTVAVRFSHLGRWSLVITLLIAVTKAALVAAVFMHLRRGAPISRLFAAMGVFWLTIMMGLTLSDFLSRKPAPAPVNAISAVTSAPAGLSRFPAFASARAVGDPHRVVEMSLKTAARLKHRRAASGLSSAEGPGDLCPSRLPSPPLLDSPPGAGRWPLPPSPTRTSRFVPSPVML